VKLLQDRQGVAANFKDHDGRTPLSRAAQYGNVKVVRHLLDAPNVEPDFTDSRGRTPLS
jgi:ankyrin repeat protein